MTDDDRQLLTAILAEVLTLKANVEDLAQHVRKPQGQRRRSNVARDEWLDQQQASGMSWPAIHAELLSVAATRGWNITREPAGLRMAWSRLQQRRRQQGTSA